MKRILEVWRRIRFAIKIVFTASDKLWRYRKLFLLVEGESKVCARSFKDTVQRRVGSIETAKRIFEIGKAMVLELPVPFVFAAVHHALDSDGIFDLMELWVKDKAERSEIEADLQDLFDEDYDEGIRSTRILSCEELDRLVSRCVAQKKELFGMVNKWGGLARLATVTSTQ